MTSSVTDSRPAQAEKKQMPRHIAVIMDGNNRWSKAKNGNAISGHREGATTARTITRLCSEKNIEYLTLFVFSSENWLRPKKEVNGLMALFLNVLKKKEINKLHEQNVKLRFIGDRLRFSKKLQVSMQNAEDLTFNNTGLTVIVAADYGGRWDISNACKVIAKKAANGEIDPETIDESTVQHYISLGDIPMPDLCIRTGGEQRISNFLLWQFAYTEFYFSHVLWPDFDEAELDCALEEYSNRQRRFGMISEQVENL